MKPSESPCGRVLYLGKRRSGDKVGHGEGGLEEGKLEARALLSGAGRVKVRVCPTRKQTGINIGEQRR